MDFCLCATCTDELCVSFHPHPCLPIQEKQYIQLEILGMFVRQNFLPKQQLNFSTDNIPIQTSKSQEKTCFQLQSKTFNFLACCLEMREGGKLGLGAFISEHICLLHKQWLLALQVVRVCVGPPVQENSTTQLSFHQISLHRLP